MVEVPRLNLFPTFPSLPRREGSVIGMTSESNVIACIINSESLMECYYLVIENDYVAVWNRANFTMIEGRSYAASAMFGSRNNFSWIVTGGEKYDSGGEVKFTFWYQWGFFLKI